jgi:ferredoxin
MPRYDVTIEKDACDGIFACLTRDPRFVEGQDGLATIDPDADPVYDCAGDVRDTAEAVVATFDDDRIAEARAAARACPTDAISVTEVDE